MGDSGVFDLLFGGAIRLLQGFGVWVSDIWNSGIHFSFATILILIALFCFFAVFFASAFLSSSLAETRGYRPAPHLLIGFFLPLIYPAIILLFFKKLVGIEVVEAAKANAPVVPKLSLKKEGIQFKSAAVESLADSDPVNEQGQTTAAASQDEKSVATASDVPVPGAEDAAVPAGERRELGSDAILDQGYLTMVAVNPDGTAAGPFVLSIEGGKELEIQRILNPLESVCVLELPPAKPGEAPRNVRLPYSKMKAIRYAK